MNAIDNSRPQVKHEILTNAGLPGMCRIALPYQFARSALFAGLPANLRQRKLYVQEEEIASVNGFRIFQRTGKQLTQSEETLWLELVHLAFQRPSEQNSSRIEVKFSANQMLRILHKGEDSKNRAALRESLNLLGDARIRVECEKNKGLSWTANLIDIASLSTGEDCSLAVYIDRSLMQSFSAGYTLQNREQRNALRGCPLAQWLHGYYSTHKNPKFINSTAIKKFSGCMQIRPKAWELKFTEALAQLEKVTRWKCMFNPKSDILQVIRNTKQAKVNLSSFKA